ncbi:GntR family transcriptional regulator [Lactobacillus colini]|uniref:GntR family transcriptional regulator n=1 Tax=Lactobacillus colini TaxID=1819254 RepID=A0ABS4MBP2_9LACO|nr:GntR family transcriptional regulator, LSA1692 subfamily [Lactobacillus colini]MBP2057096.1 GntR family transcriptional regulator [Lactobacillus colini]
MTKSQKIADIIKKRIVDGIYSPRQRLPSDYSFAKEFHASRLTVRKAIEQLINEQLLVKDPGKATYVMQKQSSKVKSGQLGLQSFTEVAKEHHKTIHTKVLELKECNQVSAFVKQKLQLETELNQNVIFLKRIRFWDETPMTLEKIYIPQKYLPNFKEINFHSSLFKILSERLTISYSQEDIDAIPASKSLAEIFDIEDKVPVFKVQSTTYTPDAHPILFDTSYYRADKYSFSATLIRSQGV